MKVALIQPRIPDGNYMPSLGLLYIGAVLRDSGFEVKLFDENYTEDVLPGIREYAPGVVGITAVTAAINRSVRLAAALKRDLPEAKVVIGGAHATAMPEEVAEKPPVDFVVYGEGEYPMLRLCEAIRDGDMKPVKEIPNLCYRADGRVVKTGKTKFLSGAELDRLPYPAFDLLDLEYVFKTSVHGLFSMGRRILPVMSSRGCPQQCAFCCRMMGFSVRERSVESVMKEVRFLVERYGIDELYIEDDNFCNNRERALEILGEIIKADLGIHLKFANGLRADTVDEEILRKIKEAGGYWVGFGIESGSERVLGLMKKNLDLDLARKNIRIAKSLGFFVGSNLIVGFPGETGEDLGVSLNYFQSLGLDSCAIVSLIPFPKTVVHAMCKRQGYLTAHADNYDNYFFKVFNPNVLVATPHLPEKKTRSAIRKFFLRFYTRPDRAFRIMKMFLRRTAGKFLARKGSEPYAGGQVTKKPC